MDDTYAEEEQVTEIAKSTYSSLRVFWDPWFTSLWTLQEAFLCPRSLIMDTMGTVLQPPVSSWRSRRGDEYEHFSRLLTTCKELYDRLNMLHEIVGCRVGAVEFVIEKLRASGLPSMATGNPLVLYGAASRRTATSEVDYLYGIQQVFSLRLGNTSPSSVQRSFGLPELEDQFGTWLLATQPIQSQIHFHIQPRAFGQGWHINRDSKIPQSSLFDQFFEQSQPLRLSCQLTARRTKFDRNTKLMGHFSGQMTSCYHLLRFLGTDDEYRIHVALDSNTRDRSAVETLTMARQRLWNQCSSLTDKDTIMVLRLGQLNSHSVGLILSLVRPNHWRRLGICTWTANIFNVERNEAGKLTGRIWLGVPVEWRAEKGFFG